MWLEGWLVALLNRGLGPKRPASAGLRLGTSTEPPKRPVVWPDARRPEHACIVGKTGAGKTHLLELLAWQLMERREPFVFLDYHGDATEHLIRLASLVPEAAQRLRVVDPTNVDRSPGLNPLEVGGAGERVAFSRASELSTILRQRWQVESFGARTEELLRNTLFVLAATGQTLVEAPLFLTSVELRTALVAQITNPDIADYFRDRFEPLSEAMKAVFREPLLNKITGFLTEPACRHLLGQAHSTIRFPEAVERGDWILINLAKGRLREHAHTLGNLIFAHLQFDVLARINVPESRRRLVTVFCDEVQNLAENDLATLLTEGRKFRVSLLTGNQFWDQLPKELRGSLLSAGTHIFFRLSSSDAATLSAELSVAHRSRLHRDLTTLSRGEALVRIGADPPQSILTPVLPIVTTTAPMVEELRQAAMQNGSVSRIDVEAEIRTRRTAPVSSVAITPDDHARPQGQQTW